MAEHGEGRPEELFEGKFLMSSIRCIVENIIITTQKLHQELKKTLEADGVLGQVRAKIKSSLYRIMESSQSVRVQRLYNSFACQHSS